MKKIIYNAFLFVFAFSTLLTSCSKDSVEPEVNQSTSKNTIKQSLSKADESSLTIKIQKFIFVKPDGASGLGHVGVALILKAFNNGVLFETDYNCGGVENFKGSPIINPCDSNGQGGYNDGWFQGPNNLAQMLQKFRERKYKHFKYTQFVLTPKDNAFGGIAIMSRFPCRGYNTFGNNCMNACYEVLEAEGNNSNTSSPNYLSNYAPNVWYVNLKLGWSPSTNL